VQTTATFRLFGDATLTAEAVTRQLGILPSRAFEAGDRISRRSQATRGSSAWLLSSSPGIEDGTELAEHLHRLFRDLEPVTAQLWDLVDAGYKANWFCSIASYATEHAAELDARPCSASWPSPATCGSMSAARLATMGLAKRTHIGQI